MRKAMAILTAATLSTWMMGVAAAGPRDSSPSISRAPVSFRLAATTPIRNFEKQAVADGRAIYVSPRAALSAEDVLAAEAIELRDGSDVRLTLTDDGRKRLTRLMKKHDLTADRFKS